MGACGARPHHKYTCFVIHSHALKNTLMKCIEQSYELVERIEVEMLKFVYKDLASRHRDMVISKEAFSDFFNMIGLWGELVFDKFDKKQNNILDYEEFMTGIEFYIKSSQDDKVKHLFELYDLDNKGGILSDEFEQMLMNYPKEELKKLLDDPTFIEEYNIVQMHEQKNSRFQTPNNKHINAIIKRPSNIQNFPEAAAIAQGLDEQSGSQRPPLYQQSNMDNVSGSERSKRLQSIDMMFPSESMIAQNGVPIFGFGIDITLKNGGKVIQIQRVNLNYLVKKYMNMVFAHKKTGVPNMLNFEEFTKFVELHPNIFNGLYRGFNYDIWGTDEKSNLPRYSMRLAEFESNLLKLNRRTRQNNPRYCMLIEHFLMEFKSKSSKLPSKIICLDGLVVQSVNNSQKQPGFEIFHKDKVYKSKTYFCKDAETYQIWIEKLQIFQKAQITDHYDLVEKIGEGRFSTVYKGKGKKDQGEYAVKIIEKFKLSREETMMLSHETEVMKLLNHSCIIKLFETIETKTHLYIVTELVNDGDLFDYICRQQYLQESDASLIMAQLFDTMAYIHKIGIVHRDLKPENIMVVYEKDKQTLKHVKLIDFGFANYLANLQDPNELTEVLCGTPNYLAPEVLEGKQITFKTDNFALGVIMFRMITGVLPFDSQFPEEILKNIQECKYELDPDIWQTVSPDALDLVKRLLEKDPADRIHIQDAINHPWIKNRKNYSGKTRVIQISNNHQLF